MSEYVEDDYDYDQDDLFCDCSDEEWDLLDCTAKCWSCGKRRNLSTAEIDNYWRAYSEFEAEMDRMNRPTWRERLEHLVRSIPRRFFSRRHAQADIIPDDEIPF